MAVTQVGGDGSFTDPRLGIHVVHKPDLVQRKPAALRDYQFSLESPEPPESSFDPVAAARGKQVFRGRRVAHYDSVLRLRLAASQKRDLVEFLKSL